MKTLIALLLGVHSFSFAGDLAREAYQGLSAQEKYEITWQKLSAEPYEVLPAMTFVPEGSSTIGHSLSVVKDALHLGLAFDHLGDEMLEGRNKIIHQYGSAAMVEFVPTEYHNYTGLFRTGALGVVRLSLGLPKASVGSFVPGMAIKLFVDGGRSRNLFAMQRLEGQGNNNNFFEHTFTNSLPEPTESSTKLGVDYFERFVENAIFLTVNHAASVEQDGTLVEDDRAPLQVFYVPNPEISMDPNNADFRLELEKIPAGTTLYEVFGVDDESDAGKKIGEIITSSPFISSKFGDERLYFQHEGTPRRGFFFGGPK